MSTVMIDDINKLSLSVRAHTKLNLLKEEGHFSEMRDAYRLAIALALSQNIRPPEILPPKASGIYSLSQIDPDQSIALSINFLMDTESLPPYRWAERLAEWGVEELSRQSESGQINIVKLIDEASEKVKTF